MTEMKIYIGVSIVSCLFWECTYCVDQNWSAVQICMKQYSNSVTLCCKFKKSDIFFNNFDMVRSCQFQNSQKEVCQEPFESWSFRFFHLTYRKIEPRGKKDVWWIGLCAVHYMHYTKGSDVHADCHIMWHMQTYARGLASQDTRCRTVITKNSMHLKNCLLYQVIDSLKITTVVAQELYFCCPIYTSCTFLETQLQLSSKKFNNPPVYLTT